jgi:hypothetical protein
VLEMIAKLAVKIAKSTPKIPSFTSIVKLLLFFWKCKG